MYANRSAIDCSPDWTNPITGTRATTNHAHPTATYGARRRTRQAVHVTTASSPTAATTTASGWSTWYG